MAIKIRGIDTRGLHCRDVLPLVLHFRKGKVCILSEPLSLGRSAVQMPENRDVALGLFAPRE